ncbi:MAG: PSD1 domain-containing protein [Verrucomicrobia bacterium]|nr:PSD1 domain-containing protein [Verrucomicrobiota bacterium]
MSGLKLFIAILVLLSARLFDAFGAAGDDGVEFFEKRIRPLLVEHCYKCHSAQSEKVKGGLLLDTREGLLKGGDTGPAIVPGDPEKSLLIKAVRQTDKDLQMPHKDKKLPDAQIADLVAWVKMGAPDPRAVKLETRNSKFETSKWWAFQSPQTPPIPKVKNARWILSPIDSFVLARLEEKKLNPAPPTDKRTLIRRATFDLIGLPPTPDEIDAFLKDKSSEAFAKVVDRLLASPHYGERWGRHWLDVVRYADTAGETADYPVPQAYLYRNYVINSFNQDKPYDQFIREQIAGDILAQNAPREKYAENVIATGYLAISRRFGFDSENYHHLTIEDTIGTLGKSILGLTLGCARCHDHKYDPVSIADYYALYGIFDSTRYAFPGSEQKQKHRALVPLLPVKESMSKWRAFEAQVASLSDNLERSKQPVPATILRSLDDLDGDFEMQAVAAGGSKGVLVPPWTYAGNIAVTKEAQSPFKNRYALGKVGVNVPSTTNGYFLAQALHPPRSRDTCHELHVNLDFRIPTNNAATRGAHRFWIGAQPSLPAVEFLISSTDLSIRSSDTLDTICRLQPNQWHNLQFRLNLSGNTVSGTIATTGANIPFNCKQLSANWPGTIDFVAVDSRGGTEGALPGIELDNLAVEETSITPVSISLASLGSTTGEASTVALADELQSLVGLDGDFELQADDTPPTKPWGPGPKSVVGISSAAQSPFCNLYPPGKLGVRLPNSGDYNGFGQTLTNTWKREKTEKLFASFDFRCVNNDAGGDGSWRFYLGHGAGGSAAVELFFNGKEFYRRSANARETVCPVRIGQWYQIQLELNLKDKTYTGTIATPDSPRAINSSPTTDAESIGFKGEFASGWDGAVDYTFIDSYGHIEGVKPALDADNFAVREMPLPPLEARAVQLADGDGESRRAKADELRRQIVTRKADLERTKRELTALLEDGPVELAYGVVEGTPHNARMQLRGDPDKPGLEVPRRFLQVLGGQELPPNTSGSGRLQLAEWLTSLRNPLTARVMVNRIWQHHFGAGIVRTPNNFGKQGRPPTHPELLDYLATQFVESGWSVKAMHRLIMLSRVYQLSSGNDAENFACDPDNEWLWNFSRHRLDAESLRDAILMVSGDLDLTVGGAHSFPPAERRNFTQHAPFLAVYESKQRSVYLMVQRIKRHPYLALFDGADANESTAARAVSTTPLQALFFMNDPFVHEQSEKFATRLINARADDHQRIILAYQLALGRAPSDAEVHSVENYLRNCLDELTTTSIPASKHLEMAWASYAGVLFSSNEFCYVD